MRFYFDFTRLALPLTCRLRLILHQNTYIEPFNVKSANVRRTMNTCVSSASVGMPRNKVNKSNLENKCNIGINILIE